MDTSSTPSPTLQIRIALPADAPLLADAHVATWRSAYRGILAQHYLDGLSVERSRERFEAILARADAVVLAALDVGRVVGFASSGPARGEGLDGARIGEIVAIYVREEAWSTGVGWRLFTASCRSPRERGYDELMICVLEENVRARRFYERAGMTLEPGVREHLTVTGVEHSIVRYRLPLAAAPIDEGASA